MENKTEVKLGRPVNPNSARQIRIQERNAKREQGLFPFRVHQITNHVFHHL